MQKILTNKQIKLAALYGAGLIILYCGLTHMGTVLSIFVATLTVIAPLIVGLAIAFIVNIPMSAIEVKLLYGIKSRNVRRTISLLSTLVLFVLVIMFVVFMLMPALNDSVAKLISAAQSFGRQVVDLVMDLSAKYPDVMNKLVESLNNSQNIPSTEKIIDTVLNFLQKGIVSITGSLTFLVSTFNSILSIFFAIMFAIYTLISKEEMKEHSLRLLNVLFKKKTAHNIRYVARKSKMTFKNFITGQCIEAIIIGLMFFITLTVLAYPYPPLIGVTISTTALIPFIGPFIGCVISAFLILMVDPIKALWFIVIFLVLQQIEGNLIYPRVVGESVGMPPFWVLLAVLIGTGTLGVIGLLTFIPVFSIIYSLVWENVDRVEKNRELKPPHQDTVIKPK